MKQTLYILLLLLLPCVGYADKKEGKKNISQIKSYIKSGKDYDKAEDLARKVLSMPEYQDDIDVALLLTETIQKQYETKNMQLYLKTLTDTASIFPLERRMFIAFQTLDSLDQKPDKKGRVAPRYRKKNCDYLNRYRPNFISGGHYFLRHKNYKEAWNCADTYLDCERQPLFSDMKYSEKDTLRYEAAFIAVVAAHKLGDHDMVAKYADIALLHPHKARYTLVDLYTDAIQRKDTTSAIGYLKQGFNRFPDFNFYFPRLVDHYMSHNQLDSVADIVSKGLEAEPGNLFYRLAFNTLQLSTEKYDDCILLGDSLIHSNDKMATAYYNVGAAYYNKALLLSKKLDEYRSKGQKNKARKVIAEQNAFYEKARPYLESYRQQRPKLSHRWAPLLYNIYLNLNMGKEFDEIETILSK